MQWAWKQRAGSATAKAVLLALADHADARGVCWPGILELAGRLEMNRRTVQRSLKQLIAEGIIQCDGRRRADGSHSSNFYILPIHAPPREGVAAPPPGDGATGESVAATGGGAAEEQAGASESHAGAAERHPHSIESSREPSKEPTIVNLKGERVTCAALWEKIRERLKEEVPIQSFEMYFSEARAVSIADERSGDQIATLVVACRSAFHAEAISRRYTMLARKFAYAEIGRVVGLRFTAKEEREEA